MKTKIIIILLVFTNTLFAQEQDSTKVYNSLNKEKEQGVFENDFKFYGIELGDSKDDYVIRFRNRRNKTQTKKRTVGVFDIDYGFNQVLNNDKQLIQSVEYPDFNLWESSYFAFSFNGKTRLFSQNSPLYFKYGIGLQWDNYTVKGDYVLTKTANGVEYLIDPNGRDLSESNLKNLYMNIPIMLQLDFSKNGVDNGFKIGVGAYAGVRYYTWQQLEFKDADGDNSEVEIRNKMHVNPFNYGLQAEIGYGVISVHAKYELSPFFEVDNPYDYKILRLGVKFSF